jgi:4-amino-4-deoxy-L-arabinose transferase-like glycosyltransferase
MKITPMLRSQTFWVIIAILTVALYRLWYCTYLELVGDEAYYWLWSRHPDICYLDKGPVIAWFIAAGTSLFGQTVFGIRFFAVVLSSATGFGIYLLAKELFSDRVALWALIMAGIAPLFAVGAVLMTIDTPYIFFWTFAALAFWRAKETTRLAPWALTGVLVGLGMLSKYTGAFELISFAIFCLLHRSSRRHLVRPTFWLMVLVAALFLLPVIYWNWAHGWPTTSFLFHRGALDEKARINPLHALVFLGGQAGVVSPLLFFGLIVVIFWPGLTKTNERTPMAYLLALFAPLFLFYLLLSFQRTSQANWAAAAYVSGFILLAAKWNNLTVKFSWTKWLGIAGLAIALIETATLHETNWLHLPAGKDPLDRARGWKDLAAQITALEKKTGTKVIIANKYMTAALLSFYLPGQPTTFMPVSSAPYNQILLWPSYREARPTDDALFISDFDRLSSSLSEDFTKIERLGELVPRYRGRKLKSFYVFLCRRTSGVQKQVSLMTQPGNKKTTGNSKAAF